MKDLSKILSSVAIAQINITAGDFEGNTKKIIEYIRIARTKNIKFVIFPELTLCGYAMDDVFRRFPFLIDENKKYLKLIQQEAIDISVLVGFVDNIITYSSAALIQNKSIIKIFNNTTDNNFTIDDIKYSITFDNKITTNADITIYYKSIPVYNKEEQLNLVKLSKKYKKAILHANPIGATDSISYCGKSALYNNGQITSEANAFDEDLFIPIQNKINRTINEVSNKTFSLNYEDEMEYTYKVLIQGIKDYFNKCGIKRAVLGLSGGLDSTVCAVLLTDALGKENVLGISMPSKITSTESKNDAKVLASNLGISFEEISIQEIHHTTNNCLCNLFKNIEKKWKNRYQQSYTNDNIQARSRAMFLWGISNEFASCIPIATSDKSEAYMGYATINGDMSGGFAPILDITKTKLFALARWLNKNRPVKNVIPQSVILKKPGAELAINPKTGETLKAEEALMPYEFLDEVIWRIENNGESYRKMLADRFIYENEHEVSLEQKTEWLDKFFKRMFSSIYKATIMPPSIIVSSPSNIKPIYYQPVSSGKIDYKGLP